MTKTNACRLLDQMKIPYTTQAYTVNPDDLSAETVAAEVGLPPERVFKTLVLRGDRNGIAVAVVPGSGEIDLKALARLTGDRKIEMLPLKEVLPVTGYIRGGCTALGMKKHYPVFVDDSMPQWEDICVSAGLRGLQIRITPENYLKAVSGTLGKISRSKDVG